MVIWPKYKRNQGILNDNQMARPKQIHKYSNPGYVSPSFWFTSWESLIMFAPVRLSFLLSANYHQGRLTAPLLCAGHCGHQQMTANALLCMGSPDKDVGIWGRSCHYWRTGRSGWLQTKPVEPTVAQPPLVLCLIMQGQPLEDLRHLVVFCLRIDGKDMPLSGGKYK